MLEHRKSCAENDTKDMVSYGSVGQQSIGEAVIKQPRAAVHIRSQWKVMRCFKVHTKSYLAVSFDSSSQCKNTGTRLHTHTCTLVLCLYMSIPD